MVNNLLFLFLLQVAATARVDSPVTQGLTGDSYQRPSRRNRAVLPDTAKEAPQQQATDWVEAWDDDYGCTYYYHAEGALPSTWVAPKTGYVSACT